MLGVYLIEKLLFELFVGGVNNTAILFFLCAHIFFIIDADVTQAYISTRLY